MNETELERLVVRLVGDGSSYLKMLKEAETASEQTAKKVEGLFSAVTGAAAGLAGGLGLKHWLTEGFENFSEAEGISIKLTAALEANGRAVEETRDEYEAFARSMEKVSTAEDDAVLNTLRMAEGFQLTGTAAENAVKQAYALAAATDVSAETALRVTAALEKGDVERAQMFSRSILPLRGIKDEAEFVAKATALVDTGFKVMGREAETASGQLKVLHRDYGNLLEEFGKTTSEIVKPVASAMVSVVGWFRQLPPVVKDVAVVVSSLVVALGTLGAVWPLLATGIAAVTTNIGAMLTAMKAAALNPFTWVVAAIALLAMLLAKVTGLTDALKALNEEMDKAKEFDKAFADRERRETARIMASIPKQGELGRAEALERELSDAAKVLDMYKGKMEEAQKVMEETFPSMERYKQASVDVRHYTGLIDALRERIAAIKKEQVADIRAAGAPSVGAGGIVGGGFLGAIAGLPALAAKAAREVKAAMDAWDSILEESKRTTEEFRTDQEKLEDRLMKLTEMLAYGTISWETYSRAVDAATNANKANSASLTDAIEVGSVAHRRIQREQYGVGGRFFDPVERAIMERGAGRAGPGNRFDAGGAKGVAAEGPEGWVPEVTGEVKEGNALLGEILGELKNRPMVNVGVAGLQ